MSQFMCTIYVTVRRVGGDNPRPVHFDLQVHFRRGVGTAPAMCTLTCGFTSGEWVGTAPALGTLTCRFTLGEWVGTAPAPGTLTCGFLFSTHCKSAAYRHHFVHHVKLMTRGRCGAQKTFAVGCPAHSQTISFDYLCMLPAEDTLAVASGQDFGSLLSVT